VVTEFPKAAKDMTLRESVEWYKNCIRTLRPLGIPTALENNLLNQRWVELLKAVADREGVPAGALSYWLSELAQTEIRLLDVAEQESAAALAYGTPVVED
jgi:hypothetical protein